MRQPSKGDSPGCAAASSAVDGEAAVPVHNSAQPHPALLESIPPYKNSHPQTAQEENAGQFEEAACTLAPEYMQGAPKSDATVPMSPESIGASNQQNEKAMVVEVASTPRKMKKAKIPRRSAARIHRNSICDKFEQASLLNLAQPNPTESKARSRRGSLAHISLQKEFKHFKASQSFDAIAEATAGEEVDLIKCPEKREQKLSGQQQASITPLPAHTVTTTGTEPTKGNDSGVQGNNSGERSLAKIILLVQLGCLMFSTMVLLPDEIGGGTTWEAGISNVTLCPRESICSEGFRQVLFLFASRGSAYFMFPICGAVFLTKCHSINTWLSTKSISLFVPLVDLHNLVSLPPPTGVPSGCLVYNG